MREPRGRKEMADVNLSAFLTSLDSMIKENLDYSEQADAEGYPEDAEFFLGKVTAYRTVRSALRDAMETTE